MIEKRVIADRFTRTLQDVMYRITKECSVFYELINIILLDKFFIHKCLYFKSPPLFIVFKNVLILSGWQLGIERRTQVLSKTEE